MSATDDQRLIKAICSTLRSGGRVLNLPAGTGGLSASLVERGYDVVSSDLFPESCTEGPKPCVFADMNERLPFEDASFDAIVSQEGVEHLENLASFLRESHRVLKPAGQIWITTPNFMDISSRMAQLFAGQKSYRAGLPNEQSTLWGRDGDRLYHGHAFSLPYFQLRYLMRVAGLEDIKLAARGSSLSSSILYPFFRPIIGLFLSRGLRGRQEKDQRKGKAAIDDELRATLYRDGVSRALLCSKGILVQASKSSEA